MSTFDALRYTLDTLRRALFDRAAWRRDHDEEIAFHLELEAMQRQHAGDAPAVARDAARRRFGRPAAVRERLADATGVSALDAIAQDLRTAARSLRASPSLTLVAVLTLALGIGATTAVFSVVSAVLLRPLPYHDGDRIVALGEGRVGAAPTAARTTSYPNFVDWRQGVRSFEAMAIYNGWGPAFVGPAGPERLRGALVTAGVFDVLRVVPAFGRPMQPADNAPGAPGLVVLSDGFWRRALAADPRIVGRAVTLNGVPRTVIAVLPPGFHGPDVLDADVWANNTFDASDGRDSRYLSALARLAPGAMLDGARAELRAVSRRLAADYPVSNGGLEAFAVPLREATVGDARRSLLLLLGASILVLAVAAANLSNLLIARGVARTREFALRAALGAGRGRVVRQLLVESTALAVLGALGGVALAVASLRGVMRLAPDVVRAQSVGIDLRVLAFTLAVLVATGLLAGLAPALRAARSDPQVVLRAGGRGTTGDAGLRLRDGLAVAQLALALALLTGAGLLVKSLARLQHVDPGVRTAGILSMRANLAPARHPRGTEARTFDAMLARIAELPGVRSAAVTSAVPLASDYDHVGIDLYGQPLREGADKLDAERFIVGGDYFRSLGIPLRAGRLFEPTDDAAHPRVAIVDETFAHEIAPGGSALGVRLSWGDSTPATVVGVVAHVRHNGPDTPSGGQIYMPHQQSPWRWMSVVVRAADGVRPTSLVPAVRGAIQSVDREQPVFDVNTLDALLAEHTAPRRFMLALLGAFAVVAVLLAAVGLYGVMAYAVVQRRRELGVRLSLGATPGHVRRLVVGRGLLLAGYGGLLGVAASIGGARLLGGILFGVRPADGTVLAAVTLLLVVVAGAASYAPARRATRADPAIVLRGD